MGRYNGVIATSAVARLARSIDGRSPIGSALLVAAGTFCLALLPLVLAQKTGGVPAFCLVNAVLLVAVLRVKPEARFVYLGAGVIGNVFARCVAGEAGAHALGLAVCDLAEVALAAFLILRRRGADATARDGCKLADVYGAAAVASGVSATLAVAIVMRPALPALASMWSAWFVREAFGMAIIVPIGIALDYRTFAIIFHRKRLAATLALLVSLLGVDTLVFTQESYPVIFIIFPLLALAAFRLGPAGSAASILITALVAVPLTLAGHGAVVLAHASSVLQRFDFLLLFLTIATWTTLPIAAALRARDVIDAALAKKWSALAESHEDLEERNARISNVIALKEAITAALPSRQAVIEVILKDAQKRTQASGAMMDRVSGNELVCEAATGAVDGSVGTRLERAASLAGLCSMLNEALSCSDTSNDERVNASVCRRFNIRSMIVLPIAFDGIVSGVLRVTSDRRHAFGPQDVLGLQLVVQHLSSAMRAASAYEQMELAIAEAQATIDNLTDGIVVFGADGAVLRHNAAAERVLGLTQQQVRAWASEEPVAAVDVDGRELSYDELPVRRALLTGLPQRDVVLGVGADVDRRWISMTVTLVPSSTGPQTERFILSARDVTCLKRSELEHREYARQLSSLHLIASKVTETGREQVAAALALCREELDMDSGYIGVVDEATSEFVFESSVGPESTSGPQADEVRLALERTLSGGVLHTTDVLSVCDLSANPDYVSPARSGRSGAYIAVPIRVSERVYGAIGFTSRRARPQGFSASERDFVRITADLIASAIERRLQRERLDSLAHHDALTGLPNRLVFEDRLAQTLLAAKRHQQLFAVLYIDLDGFKAVNDTYGHGAGDEVLRTAARRMQAVVRESDTLARIGGDEFLILAPTIDSWTDASDIAWRVVETMRLPIVINGVERAVRASVGASVYPEDAIDADSMVRGADAALYRAKVSGKNSVGFARANVLPRKFERSLQNVHDDVARRAFCPNGMPMRSETVSGSP